MSSFPPTGTADAVALALVIEHEPQLREALYSSERLLVEMTADPGWAYCPRCNALSDWSALAPNCPPSGLCRGRSLLPIPTTADRERLTFAR